jgi:hypothetical protein
MTNTPFDKAIYASGKTAMARKKASVPARLLASFAGELSDRWCIGAYFNGNSHTVARRPLRILDHGCGKGTDIEFFNTLPNVVATGYDPIHGPQWFDGGIYDVITSTYVLNTLPGEIRKQIMISMAANLERHALSLPNSQAFALVSVRHFEDIERCKKDNWERDVYGGYTTTRGTYQFGYEPEELAEELLANGFGQVHMLSKDPLIVVAFILKEASWMPIFNKTLKGSWIAGENQW